MKIAREARKTRVIRPATSNQLPQALQQQPRQRADQPSSQNRSQKSVQKSSNMKAGTPDQQKEPQTEPMNTKRALRPGTQYQISHSNAKPTPRSTKLEPQKQSENTQKQKGKTQDTIQDRRSRRQMYVSLSFSALVYPFATPSSPNFSYTLFGRLCLPFPPPRPRPPAATAATF